jgi:hypothetical protein
LCLRCEVRVARVEERGAQLGFGVACQMDDFTISRSAR